MARIRSIHPGFFTDEAIVSASPQAQIFLIGIWTQCDDQGVFEWKPVTLKMRILPAANCDVVVLLAELTALGIIKQVDVGPLKYGLVRNFRKYQRPKKPNPTFPLPVQFRTYVGLDASKPEPDDDEGGSSSPPVPHQGGTGSEISPQMEDGGGRMEEEGGEEEGGDDHEGSSDSPSDDDLTPPLEPDQSREAQIVAAWNAAADIVNEDLGRVEWQRVQKLTPKRKAAVKKLLKVCGLAEINTALDHAMTDPWALGETKRPAEHENWRFNFDYFVRVESVTRFLEAPKNGAHPRRPPPPTNGRMAALNAVRERLRRKEQPV